MDENEKTKSPSFVKGMASSEILKNYAGAIAILLGALPAVGSLVVSLMTAYRGEPVAEKTWSTVRTQLNQQAETINKLHLRVVQFQAHEEGKSAAAIQLKLDELQKKYDQLRAKAETASTSPASPSPPSSTVASSACRDGYIRIKERCRPVPKAVADKVKEDEKKTEDIRRKWIEEKIRRLKEEKLRRNAEQKVQAVQKTELLRPLPKKLDDVVKGN